METTFFRNDEPPTKWESEWGRELKIPLCREERSLIWEVLFDLRDEKRRKRDALINQVQNTQTKLDIKHLNNEIAMIDEIRKKMTIMY